jgi:minimal PKS chain-length factor (CLF/KS beta)
MIKALVTGLGVIAPNGVGAEAYWAATLAGRSGLGRISRFSPAGYPATVAGEVTDFVLRDHVPSRAAAQTDRWSHFGLAAAQLALADAGVEPATLPEYEMAVVTASSSGGTEFGQREIQALWSKGSEHVGAFQSIAWFYAATTGQLSIRHGMRGPCGVLCAEQAGGLDAAQQARRVLSDGARLVLAGGTDASLCPYGLTAQSATGKLSTSPDPRRAYLPFDVNASGYVPGEGGAVLVVEHEVPAVGRADRRGYGVIAGHGATFDPGPHSRRRPTAEAGGPLRRAIELALAQAGLRPCDIDVVFADAIGVPALDRAEANAISGTFGPYQVPVTAPKTMVGRLYAGGAALDVATALLAIRDGVIPPTAGVTRMAPHCDIDLVTTQPRERRVGSALVLARGHGGFNSALVLTAPPEPNARSSRSGGGRYGPVHAR